MIGSAFTSRGIFGFFAATNLCVAYIKTGDLEHAETSCAAAVDEITVLAEARSTGYGVATDSMGRAVNGQSNVYWTGDPDQRPD